MNYKYYLPFLPLLPVPTVNATPLVPPVLVQNMLSILTCNASDPLAPISWFNGFV